MPLQTFALNIERACVGSERVLCSALIVVEHNQHGVSKLTARLPEMKLGIWGKQGNGYRRTGICRDNSDTAKLDYYKDRQSQNQKYNSEMSKWILGSLIAANGGPFLLLSKDTPAAYAGALQHSALYFGFGIAAAIICGWLAWLNTGMREAIYNAMVRQLMTGATSETEPAGIRKIVTASYVVSIIAGLASLILFVVGVVVLARAMTPHH